MPTLPVTEARALTKVYCAAFVPRRKPSLLLSLTADRCEFYHCGAATSDFMLHQDTQAYSCGLDLKPLRARRRLCSISSLTLSSTPRFACNAWAAIQARHGLPYLHVFVAPFAMRCCRVLMHVPYSTKALPARRHCILC